MMREQTFDDYLESIEVVEENPFDENWEADNNYSELINQKYELRKIS